MQRLRVYAHRIRLRKGPVTRLHLVVSPDGVASVDHGFEAEPGKPDLVDEDTLAGEIDYDRDFVVELSRTHVDEDLSKYAQKADDRVARHETLLVESRGHRVVKDDTDELVEHFIGVEET